MTVRWRQLSRTLHALAKDEIHDDDPQNLAKAAAASLTLAATTGVMAQQPTELRVGLIPSEDAQAMMRASQQVMDQLAAKTG
jgi:ABC-type phosphate/phosphonate transport system substrate-binding protein